MTGKSGTLMDGHTWNKLEITQKAGFVNILNHFVVIQLILGEYTYKHSLFMSSWSSGFFFFFDGEMRVVGFFIRKYQRGGQRTKGKST